MVCDLVSLRAVWWGLWPCLALYKLTIVGITAFQIWRILIGAELSRDQGQFPDLSFAIEHIEHISFPIVVFNHQYNYDGDDDDDDFNIVTGKMRDCDAGWEQNGASGESEYMWIGVFEEL
ncbi:hypothetical protein DFH09DRAFT_1070544 [Mycena vulgaris]|nr:hypothetical protein DFH09DRAFT_1070544 [Mycena vulgaris]